TFRPFQSVELSLPRLLPSRAWVRFAQQPENTKLVFDFCTDTVYRTEPFKMYKESLADRDIYCRTWTIHPNHLTWRDTF
ncbi:MAG TPA: hypothetical protein VD927_05775, partial [Chryseosolibacter sp.]|nr:hypothetical protein [Chryseosolibacter sp.]